MIERSSQHTKRYERKFVVDSMDAYAVRDVIRFHPAAFHNIYNPRFINNLYFDTPNFNFYYDNHFGKADRVKVRIRWYGEFKNAAHPYLEIKKKNGLVGDKDVYRLKPFQIGSLFDTKNIMRHLQECDLPANLVRWLKDLEPKILNRYHRQYFLSGDKNFRMTFDDKIQYFAVEGKKSTLKKCYSDYSHFVLELKYTVNQEHEAGEITRHLPFRIDKNSKYVNGVDCFNYMAAV